MTPDLRRARALSATLLAGLFSSASSCPPAQPRTIALTVGASDRMALEYGPHGSRISMRRYRIFGGTAASSVRVNTVRAGMTAGSPIRIGPEGAAPVATLTTDSTPGEAAVEVPGRVAVIEMDWDGNGSAPTVSAGATIVAATGNIVSPPGSRALEMNLNGPVELFFSPNDPVVYYLAISGVGSKPVDVVLDGPGRVFVSDPARGRIVLDATTGAPLPDAPAPLAVIDAASGGLVRFNPVAPLRDRLLLTVGNLGLAGAARRGHARLSVNEVFDTVDLGVWFNNAAPPGQTAFGGRSTSRLTAEMAEIANAASANLYQATAGRIRIGSLKVFVQPQAPTAHVDARIDPFNQPWEEHVFGFQDQPWVVIELDEQWFQNSVARAGKVLAHEFFHYRYALPDEYRPPYPDDISGICQHCLCPFSIMSEPGDELCWPGSHNPFGDDGLANRTLLPPANSRNTSMWQYLSTRFGFAVPSSTPPRVLRPSSTVALVPGVAPPGLGQPCGGGPLPCAINAQCSNGACRMLNGGPSDSCDANRLCGATLACRCPVLPHPNNCFVASTGCAREVPSTTRGACPLPLLPNGGCPPGCFTDASNRCMVETATTVRQSCQAICLP